VSAKGEELSIRDLNPYLVALLAWGSVEKACLNYDYRWVPYLIYTTILDEARSTMVSAPSLGRSLNVAEVSGRPKI